MSIWHCRDAASAELGLDQLQEVQLAFQKMDIYSGANENIYQSLAQAMGWLLQWLKGKADGGSLASKGYERFEGVWAGHQVNTHNFCTLLLSRQKIHACNMLHGGGRKTLCFTVHQRLQHGLLCFWL